MLAVVVISFVAKWQQTFFFATERSSPTEPIPLKPISHESKELLNAIRFFCEEEGLAPRSLAEIEEYSHSTNLRDLFTLFTVPDHPALIINQKGTQRSLHLLFSSTEISVITRERAIGELSFREEYFYNHQNLSYKIQSFPSRRSTKVEKRLRQRVQTNDEEAWKELISYMIAGDRGNLGKLCREMQRKLPSSRWAKLVIPCLDLSSQKKGQYRGLAFRNLVHREPDFYPDYFQAARRSLPKLYFLSFARQTFPRVPAAYQSACAREAAIGAYNVGQFKLAIQFCRSWKTPDSAIVHSAALLAVKSSKAAVSVYQRHRGPPIGRPDHNNLELALLKGDVSYRLPEETFKTESIFLKPLNFLGFDIHSR